MLANGARSISFLIDSKVQQAFQAGVCLLTLFTAPKKAQISRQKHAGWGMAVLVKGLLPYKPEQLSLFNLQNHIKKQGMALGRQRWGTLAALW